MEFAKFRRAFQLFRREVQKNIVKKHFIMSLTASAWAAKMKVVAVIYATLKTDR
jgi:hypothetical protein